MNHPRAHRSAAIFAATSLLALAACGNVPPSSGAGASSGGGAPAEESGRIAVAHMQPPRSGLTPLSDDAFKLSRWSAAETLVRLDEQGDAQPLLATAWAQKTPTTWSFTLREGVTFHDGTAMTSENVAAWLNYAATATPPPRILDGVKMSAKAVGNTVEVSTAEADPLLPHRLSSPQLAVFAPAAYAGKGVSPVNTGTGPFKLTEVRGTAGATLERFDGYWGEKAKAPGIDVSFVPDGTARTAALRTGEAHIVEAIPAGQVATVDAAQVHEVPMPRTNTLYLNTKNGPFTDPALRAGVREAINTDAIVDTTYEGRADAAQGLLGPSLPWAAEARATPAVAEIMKARAPGKPGSGHTITIGTFTDRAELPEVAVHVQEALQAKGYTVKLDVREYQYIEPDALDGKFDAFILSRATVLDSGDPVAYLASDFSCEGSFNLSQMCDASVDAAIEKAAATPPGDERRAAIAAAEATILSRDAAIPLLHERVIQGEVPGVSNAVRDPRERELISADTSVSG